MLHRFIANGIVLVAISLELILETFLEQGLQGFRSAGVLLIVIFRDCGGNPAGATYQASVPSRVYVALNYDCALSIKDAGRH